MPKRSAVTKVRLARSAITAAQSGDVIALQHAIDQGINLDSIETDGHTALWHAVWKGNKPCLDMLICAGADVDHGGPQANPLMFAVKYGLIGCFTSLLRAGADVHVVDSHGTTAVMLAAEYSPPEYLVALLEAGADPSMQTKYGISAIHQAAVTGRSENLRVLLQAGANVDFEDSEGDTALHYAASSGAIECAMILMKAGASRSAKNREGQTPADAARYQQELETEKSIRSFVPLHARQMLRWRQAADAKRDSMMVFRAAAEGRPMELTRRLRLGKLAGGLTTERSIELPGGGRRRVRPLEAAVLRGHDECVSILREVVAGM